MEGIDFSAEGVCEFVRDIAACSLFDEIAVWADDAAVGNVDVDADLVDHDTFLILCVDDSDLTAVVGVVRRRRSDRIVYVSEHDFHGRGRIAAEGA